MDFDKLTSNLNSAEFQKYLKYYETFHIDRKKCVKIRNVMIFMKKHPHN